MAKKTVPFTKEGIGELPDDKPVVYDILTPSGNPNYIGSAKRGRVQDRLMEHLNEGAIPGAKIRVDQKPTINEAQRNESTRITRSKPKYNDK